MDGFTPFLFSKAHNMKALICKTILCLFFFTIVPLTLFAKNVTEDVETVSVKLLGSATLIVPESWMHDKEAYDGSTSTWSTNNPDAVQFGWKSYNRCTIRLLNPAMYATEPIEVYFDFIYFPNAVLTYVRLVWTIVVDDSGQIYSLSPKFYSTPIALGGDGVVEINVNASEDADKTVVFTSSDTTIVKIEATDLTKAVMWGVGVGKAKITAAAAAKPSIKSTFEVEVKAPNAGDTFNYDGVTYQVTDTKNKECRVGELHNYGSFTAWERAVPQNKAGKITIPSTVYEYRVTSIGEQAFYECKNISEVVISEGVTVISKSAFYGCSGLTSVSIPNSVTTIEEHAFQNCSGLISIALPNSMLSIGGAAFYACQSLVTILLPDDIHSIGEYAFHETPWFDSKPDGVLYIGKIAYLYKGNVPEKSTISIKEGTIGIGSSFAKWTWCSTFSNIVGLDIPASVTSIGEYAFLECQSLRTIRSRIEHPFKISDTTFSDETKKEGSLFVPAGSKQLYKASEGWNEFKTILDEGEVAEMKGRKVCDINATNFPDAAFRNYLLSQDYGNDAELSAWDVATLTQLSVSNMGIVNMKGIEFFIELKTLECSNNQLESLDVSKNTALTTLKCYENQLTSLDLSKNTSLTRLFCSVNHLTSLDVSHNIALKDIYCHRNKIKGVNMDALINSLPQNETNDIYKFRVFNNTHNDEYNVCTKAQVAAAKAKGWTAMCYNGSWMEYEGSDDEQSVMKGDVNGDGEVNGTDLVAMTNMILGKTIKNTAADLNGDGEVNGTDYVTLVNIVLGK